MSTYNFSFVVIRSNAKSNGSLGIAMPKGVRLTDASFKALQGVFYDTPRGERLRVSPQIHWPSTKASNDTKFMTLGMASVLNTPENKAALAALIQLEAATQHQESKDKSRGGRLTFLDQVISAPQVAPVAPQVVNAPAATVTPAPAAAPASITLNGVTYYAAAPAKVEEPVMAPATGFTVLG